MVNCGLHLLIKSLTNYARNSLTTTYKDGVGHEFEQILRPKPEIAVIVCANMQTLLEYIALISESGFAQDASVSSALTSTGKLTVEHRQGTAMQFYFLIPEWTRETRRSTQRGSNETEEDQMLERWRPVTSLRYLAHPNAICTEPRVALAWRNPTYDRPG